EKTKGSRHYITSPETAGDFLGIWDWGGYAGPVVLPDRIRSLFASAASTWIVVEFSGIDDDWTNDPILIQTAGDLALAAALATHVIIAPDLDDVHHIAGALAASGGRVLLIERKPGASLPMSWGAT